MKKLLCLSLCALSLGSSAYAAGQNQIDMQAGIGLHILGTPIGSQTLGYVSYRYTNNWYYLRAGAGGWLGSRGTGITAVQAGFNYKDFSIGSGPAYITNTTSSLGTHYQFMSSARWTFNPYPIFIEYDHVSDARMVLGGPGPNLGENFISAGYSYRF